MQIVITIFIFYFKNNSTITFTLRIFYNFSNSSAGKSWRIMQKPRASQPRLLANQIPL